MYTTNMKNIQHKDITFVMQGAIASETNLAINQIKKLMPKSKIILSTWQDQDVSNINCDLIIKSDDPGSVNTSDIKMNANNVNRMLVSTLNGLKKVKTKYAIKIRTDCTIKNNDFIKLYEDMIQAGNQNCYLFKQPILMDFIIDNFAIPYFASDFFNFGLTEDLINFWDIPIITKNEAEFLKSKKCKSGLLNPFYRPIKNQWSKYFYGEQILLCKFLEKKKIDIDFKHQQDNITFKKLKQSAKLIVNNFVLVNHQQIPLHCYKYELDYNGKVYELQQKILKMNKMQWVWFMAYLTRRAIINLITEK